MNKTAIAAILLLTSTIASADTLTTAVSHAAERIGTYSQLAVCSALVGDAMPRLFADCYEPSAEDAIEDAGLALTWTIDRCDAHGVIVTTTDAEGEWTVAIMQTGAIFQIEGDEVRFLASFRKPAEKPTFARFLNDR